VKQISTVHEGMRGVGTDVSTYLRGNMGLTELNSEHQLPFNRAAKNLLEP
jgi:hypothetical protein